MAATKKTTRVIFGLAVVAVLALFAILRWPYLEMPLERDEGTYLVLGHQVTQGAVPYEDIYEMKPPGLFYAYAILSAIGGYGFEGARTITLLLHLVNGLFLFFILRRTGWLWGALGAMIAFLSLSMNPYFHGFALLPEPIMIFLFLSGILCLQFARAKNYRYLLAAAFLVSSFWIKQNMMFPLIFVGLLLLYRIIRSPLPEKQPLLYFMAGGVAVPVFTLLPIVLQGGWDDFYYWVWTYPKSIYTQSISWSSGFSYMTKVLELSWSHLMVWVIAAGLGFAFHFALKQRLYGRATPLLFLVFSFLAVMPGLRFYGHYWMILLPAIAVGVGAFFEGVHQLLRMRFSRLASGIAISCLLLGLTSGHIFQQSKVYFSPNIEEWSRLSYGNNPFLEIHDIAKKLKDYASTKEDVVVMGSEPQLYVYLQATPFTSHTFITFLNKVHPRRGEMRSEFTSDVQQAEPKYMVFVNHPYSWSISDQDRKDVHQWAYRYAKNYYRPIGLYEMDGTAKDRKIWSEDAGQLQPRSQYYVQILIRK